MSETVPERRPAPRWLPAVLGLTLLAGVIAAWWAWTFTVSPPKEFIDLDYYRAATVVAVAGQPLFASLPYPPIALLAIAPLGGLPVVVGNQVWSAVTLAVGLGLAYLVTQRGLAARGVEMGRQQLGLYGLTATALILSMPFITQLNVGQLTLFIVALTLVDTAGLLPRRWQGVGVGVAGAIKVFPMVFVPYYLVTGQRRQAAMATGSFALVTAIGFALFPADSLVFWSVLGKNDQFGDPSRWDNMSIQATVYRVLPSLGSVSAIWLALAVVVLAAALWRARQHHLRGERFAGVLTVGAASVVLSPISWPHYHVWLPLLAIWLVLAATRRRDRLIAIGIYTAYSMPVTILFLALSAEKVLASILTLVCMLIGLLGLPHLPDRPAQPAAEPTG
ncbi:MAG: DUF2029 domain-containing protein [Propionibacteriaceae bacterium]|nr:DUF2029 domain-containing protein [Propionibacteriaceae bacterium]